MSLVAEAEQNTEQTLVELNPLVEADLYLIIKTYEETLRSSETEEGIIISNYGEVSKQEGGLNIFTSVLENYGGDVKSSKDEGNSVLDFAKDAVQGFLDCFECDGRITLQIQNLPLPDLLIIFGDFLLDIEVFLDQLKALLNPIDFYSDTCALLDTLRIVCPQDLILLLATLQFSMTHYLQLSFQLDLDWIAILGILLFPIMLLIHTLLQIIANISIGPMKCLQSILITGYQVQAAAKASAEIGISADINIGQTDVQLDYNATTELEYSGSVLGTDDEKIAQQSKPLSIGTGDFSLNSDILLEKALQGFGGDTDPSKFGGWLSIIAVSADTIKVIEALLGRFTKSLQTLVALSGEGLRVRMRYMTILVTITRLIGFITALINALSSKSICTDPTQPLSSNDIQQLIAVINGSNTIDTSNVSVVGKVTPSDGSLVSSTTSLDFDTATGEIVIGNTVTDESARVPACLSNITSDDRDKILSWAQELETSST